MYCKIRIVLLTLILVIQPMSSFAQSSSGGNLASPGKPISELTVQDKKIMKALEDVKPELAQLLKKNYGVDLKIIGITASPAGTLAGCSCAYPPPHYAHDCDLCPDIRK